MPNEHPNAVVPGGPPPIPRGRRLRRFLVRRLPLLVWIAGALAAGWLYLHERPRGQAVAAAELSEVRVVSEASGRLLRLAVQEGQPVKAGEVVALLDPGDLEDRISRGRAILQQLQSIAGANQDEIKLYELKLADLLREKEKYTLVARASGRIESLLLRAGEWVNPGTEIAVIEAAKPGRLTAYLGDSRLPLVRGTRTVLRPRNKSGVAVQGRVVKVSPHLEQLPPRLHHEAPSLAAWGRSVTIELDRAADFSPGEIYDVNFLP